MTSCPGCGTPLETLFYCSQLCQYRVALQYITSPTMGLPGDRDALDFAMDGATEECARRALQTCIRIAREALR